MKKLFALLLACAMTLGVATTSASAATTRFTDVPADFWAHDAIEALAEGGLVGGYGGGYFGPNDSLNVDQLAQIISNAKGHYEDSGNSYWAYDEVYYCIYELKCLPNFGEITRENYSKPATRELAIYMVTKGLGASGVTEKKPNLTAQDIPDYASIDRAYASTILQAYQWGLTAGTDTNGTFSPKSILSRAQACTVLWRAGFTTAVERPIQKTSSGLSGEEIFAAVKAAYPNWREFVGGSYKTLTATERIYGGLSVKVNGNGVLSITMKEENEAGQYLNNNIVDANGNIIPQEQLEQHGFKDPATGKILVSSAWSYEPRQIVKDIMKKAFPTSSVEAYEAMLSAMKSEIWEVPGNPLPSAHRWIDGRCLTVTTNYDTHSMTIWIDPVGEDEGYYEILKKPSTGVHSSYISAYGGTAIETYYELNRG